MNKVWCHMGSAIGFVDQNKDLVPVVFLTENTKKSDVSLITSAPELLFCLQVICEHAGEDFDRLDGMLHLTEAKKAIAKALGESNGN